MGPLQTKAVAEDKINLESHIVSEIGSTLANIDSVKFLITEKENQLAEYKEHIEKLEKVKTWTEFNVIKDELRRSLNN